MRVFNISGFVLLTGIIGCIIGGGEVSAQYERAPPHLSILGYVDTTAEDVENYDKEMCARNGGPEAYRALENNLGIWNMCIYGATVTVNDQIANETDEDTPESAVKRLKYEKYCKTVPMLEYCLHNVTNSLKNCLDPEKKESAEIFQNVTTSLMQFLCANVTARRKTFAEFIGPTGAECFSSREQAINRCANQTFSDYLHSKISDGALIGGFGIGQWFIPDVEKCTNLADFQRCIVREFNDCSTPPTFGNLVDSIFDHVKTVSNCDALLTSKANP